MITLLLLLLPLCACGGSKSSGEALALKIRTSLLEVTALSVSADITADYGERVYDFSVKFSGNADSGVIEIMAPEAIAGLTATVNVSGTTLSYDGAVLDTGAITGDGLSPAETIPVLISQWQSGYISGCNYEKLGDTDALAVTTDISETVSQRTWFDIKTQKPIRAELSDGGKMVVACRFGDVIIN
jgi:hypothetical protein